jgi:hypothetical protein
MVTKLDVSIPVEGGIELSSSFATAWTFSIKPELQCHEDTP